jgi:hypothetical protein
MGERLSKAHAEDGTAMLVEEAMHFVRKNCKKDVQETAKEALLRLSKGTLEAIIIDLTTGTEYLFVCLFY